RRVSDLQSRLVGMEKSPRVLEKTAREELHLVHENELLVLFDTPVERSADAARSEPSIGRIP
ncbi:hypothetical protein MRY87_12910, partial [bacterium]|nr:hypothetical protein [bacterium]